MADTYKHKLKYKSKQIYKLCTHGWSVSCSRECPAFNFPWYKVPSGDHRKKFARKYLQDQFRSQVKRKMRMGDYDNLPTRPLRFAWFID